MIPAVEDFEVIRARHEEIFPAPRCPAAASRPLRECMRTPCSPGCPMEHEPRTRT